MRFRPANISLINRRHYLPRLLLTLSSFEKNDQRILTGHYISLPDCRPPGNYSTQGGYRIPDRTEAEEQKRCEVYSRQSRILAVGRTEPGTPTSARLVPPRPAPNRLHLRDASAPY